LCDERNDSRVCKDNFESNRVGRGVPKISRCHAKWRTRSAGGSRSM
jgi:hypothetical protein